MKRYALFAAVVMFVSLFIVSGASAVIRCVNATPVLGCPSYTTIQAAVNAALPADTIVVHPGVYYENVVVNGNAPDFKFNITIQGGKVVVISGRLSVQATLPEQAVVDARPVFDTCTGPGFNIDAANNISIKSLTVRHACSDGFSADNIYSTGSYTFIDKVYSLNSSGDGVNIDGDHATIQNSVFFGNNGDGVDVTGYALIQNNSIWNNYYDGVYVNGPNSTVTRNDIKTTDDADCIHLCWDSDGAKVTYNTIQSCDQDGIGSHHSSNQDISNNTIKSVYYNGIYVYGDDSETASNITIKNNTIKGVGSHGILLENYVSNSVIDRNNISTTHDEGIHVDTRPDSFVAANVVSNNLVENIHSAEGINVSDRKPTLTTNTVQYAFNNDCFEVSCGSGDCISGGQITNNKAFYCGEDDDGYSFSNVWNILISGNIAEHIHNDGFYIGGNNNTIQNNTARWCGTHSDAGFDIEGDNNIINANLAEFNSQGGFQINGNNTITRNIARKNYKTGMWLGYADGGTVNVTYNTITDNHGEGLANFAPNGGGSTVNISNNTVLRNRTDICNEGIITTFISNIFNTGGLLNFCDLE
jgi:hypothetical protein